MDDDDLDTSGVLQGCSIFPSPEKAKKMQQMTTLLQCTKLTDGAVSVEIVASSMRPLGARGVIYNVPLDIFTDDLVACFPSQGVKFVQRFRFKSSDSSELKDSKFVFLTASAFVAPVFSSHLHNIYDQFVKIYTDGSKLLNEPVAVYT